MDMKWKMAVLIGAIIAGSFLCPAPDAWAMSKNTQEQTVETASDAPGVKEDKNKETPPADALNKKAEKKEKASVPALAPIDGKALTDNDFKIGGISFGDPVSHVISLYGNPASHLKNDYANEYNFNDFVVISADDFIYRYMERKDLSLDQKFSNSGVSAIYVIKDSLKTSRGISVGSSRESVVRAYGSPSGTLWDGRNRIFYLNYRMGPKQIIFTIKNDKVEDFRLSSMKSDARSVSDYRDIGHSQYLPLRDFKIAGYELNTVFKQYPWEDWIKKMTNPREEIWYYPGYAVRFTAKSHLIQGLLVEDHDMITNRGLSLGDDISTVDLLYGAPGKIELDSMSIHPKTAYIYFSTGREFALIIYLENNKVTGIVSTINPRSASFNS